MSRMAAAPVQAFEWARHPEAETFVREMLAGFLSRCPPAAELSRRMTRLQMLARARLGPRARPGHLR